MLQLYRNGKPKKDIIREYELTPCSLEKRINQHQTSGSFQEKDNLTPEQKELKQLQIENDILNQAARY